MLFFAGHHLRKLHSFSNLCGNFFDTPPLDDPLVAHLSQNCLVSYFLLSEHDDRGSTHCCVVGGDDLFESG